MKPTFITLCIVAICLAFAPAVVGEVKADAVMGIPSADSPVSLDFAQNFEPMPNIVTPLELKSNRVQLVDSVASEKFQVGFATVMGAALIIALLIW
jgi:hypothetical protein